MDMEHTPISRILLKLSLPVMLSLLIQSIYNIVDNFFVARYSVEGLTALSLIYPVQLLMIAQVTGSIVNVILDPLLIFGIAFFPKLGIAGAAIATVIGQWAAMFITLTAVLKKYSIQGHFSFSAVRQIYQNGIGSIVTQSLYTLYIVGLNMILKGFTEDAVTVLGLYYKIQSFFFIPLIGFQQVLLPVISYNYGAGKIKRTRDALKFASFLSCGIMVAATLIFILFPDKLLGIFSTEASILSIGCFAFRVISLSFVPAGLTIAITSYLQGVARMKESVFIIVLRQVFLLVPLAWVLHFLGLSAVWWTFPLTEIIASLWGVVLVIVKDKTLKTT